MDRANKTISFWSYLQHIGQFTLGPSSRWQSEFNQTLYVFWAWCGGTLVVHLVRAIFSAEPKQLAMAKTLISLVLALILVSSALGSSDVPFIVAHKKASLTRLKSGAERVSVSVDIYNQGSTYVFILSDLIS